MANFNDTQQFSVPVDESRYTCSMDAEEVLSKVYQALKEKGYNPETQIVGYIMSGDPTYITSHNNARSLVMKVDRDEILSVLVRAYIEKQDS